MLDNFGDREDERDNAAGKDFFNAFDDGFDDMMSGRGSVIIGSNKIASGDEPPMSNRSANNNLLGDLQREIQQEEEAKSQS